VDDVELVDDLTRDIRKVAARKTRSVISTTRDRCGDALTAEMRRVRLDVVLAVGLRVHPWAVVRPGTRHDEFN
jgi:hypothetical protein